MQNLLFEPEFLAAVACVFRWTGRIVCEWKLWIICKGVGLKKWSCGQELYLKNIICCERIKNVIELRYSPENPKQRENEIKLD
jgi:hypothetical protein